MESSELTGTAKAPTADSAASDTLQVFKFQQVAVYREKLLKNRDWRAIAREQLRAVFTMTDRTDKFLRRMADLYSEDAIGDMFDPGSAQAYPTKDAGEAEGTGSSPTRPAATTTGTASVSVVPSPEVGGGIAESLAEMSIDAELLVHFLAGHALLLHQVALHPPDVVRPPVRTVKIHLGLLLYLLDLFRIIQSHSIQLHVKMLIFCS